MTLQAARHTVDNYVCAHCWGPLLWHDDGKNDLVLVKCANECGGEGFVSRKGVERREAEGEALAAEARYNLRNIIPQQKKSSKQILSELGF